MLYLEKVPRDVEKNVHLLSVRWKRTRCLFSLLDLLLNSEASAFSFKDLCKDWNGLLKSPCFIISGHGLFVMLISVCFIKSGVPTFGVEVHSCYSS